MICFTYFVFSFLSDSANSFFRFPIFLLFCFNLILFFFLKYIGFSLQAYAPDEKRGGEGEEGEGEGRKVDPLISMNFVTLFPIGHHLPNHRSAYSNIQTDLSPPSHAR